MADNSAIHTGTHALSANSVHETNLSPKQEAFAQAYIETGSVAAAYREAYNVGDSTAAATVRNNGHKILGHPKVAARVRTLRAALCEGAFMTSAELVSDLEAIVNADVEELVSLVVGCCRRCWGDPPGAYQWRNPEEWAFALDRHIASLVTAHPLSIPEPASCFGFSPDKEPNPSCFACNGAGEKHTRFNIVDASPGAKKLFKGLELFPDGSIKRVLLHDQMAARMELHKIKGLHVERSINVNANVTVPALKDMSTAEALNFLESLRPTRPALPVIEHDRS